MTATRHPHLWLTIWLVAGAFAGTVLLTQGWARPIDPDTFRWYWARHIWQNAFDSLSAICGCGLLVNRIDDDYTPAGRWVLFGLSQLGAVLFIGAAARALRAWQPASAARRLPHPLLVVLVFLLFQALLVAATVVAARSACPDADVYEALRLAAGAACGVSLLPPSTDSGTFLMLAVLGIFASLGWATWLLLIPPLAKRCSLRRRTLALAGAWLAFVFGAGLLICALETPRATNRPPPPGPRALPLAEWRERLPRSLLLAASVAGAGAASEPLSEGRLSDGAKTVLALVVLVGGLGGSAAGGVKWALLLAGLTAAGAVLRGRAPRSTTRVALLGAAALTLLVAWTLIAALGLLLIERTIASEFQRPPTFADALLDASAVVGGAAISSGVTATVTDPNLTAGIGLTSNRYQYGMLWLMLAMLIGRVLPIFVIARATTFLAPVDDEPATPLI